MCKALDDWEKQTIQKGLNRGLSQGLSQGLSRGLSQGIKGTLEILKNIGQSKQDAMIQISKTFSLSPDEAQNYMQKYW